LNNDEEGKNYTIDDESVDKAIEKIKDSKEEEPFCLFLGLNLPHPPYQIEEPYFSAIDKNKMKKRVFSKEGLKNKPSILKIIAKEQKLQELSEDDWDEIRKCYLGMCMKTDYLFGKVCDALKEKGIYDDTAIFVFSDHGDYTGDYGIVEKTQNTFEDCLVKVPFIIKPPKGYEVDAGISDSLVELVDLYPTLMEMCGIRPAHSHFGKSLVPVIENRNTANKEFVFSEGGRLKGEVHCDESNGKTTHPFNPYYPRKTAQLDDTAHTKATMIRTDKYKYIRRIYEMDEFYDLVNDPEECSNQINNPNYCQIINDLKMNMLEWYQTTADIVPFEQDERFNYEMIWNRVKINVPENLKEEVQQKIRNGADMFQLIEWVRNAAK
jgi:arylsulfatase A-like enzyme